jgi:hypothetical protein
MGPHIARRPPQSFCDEPAFRNESDSNRRFFSSIKAPEFFLSFTLKTIFIIVGARFHA